MCRKKLTGSQLNLPYGIMSALEALFFCDDAPYKLTFTLTISKEFKRETKKK